MELGNKGRTDSDPARVIEGAEGTTSALGAAGASVDHQLGRLLQSLRLARGLSLRTLAARTGFSPSFISQVEHDQASPSIASLGRIVDVLGITLGELFLAAGASQAAAAPALVRPVVVPKGRRQTLTSAWSRARIEGLGPAGRRHALEPVMITFSPGGRSGREMHTLSSEAIAIVFEGDLVLTLDAAAHVLHRGDTVTLPARTPHRWENSGDVPASVVVVALAAPHGGLVEIAAEALEGSAEATAETGNAGQEAHYHVIRSRKRRVSVN
jgi:transcriptional regulator with XRE-family HTH domain